MSKDHDLDSIDQTQPHAFVEKMNVPFAIPRAPGPMMAAPEFAFKRDVAASGCALCEKPHSDHIHQAADQAADGEHWPV
jgi:hypothetical protein